MANREKTKQMVAVLLLTVSAAAMSEDELPVPAVEFEYCTVCHGVQVMGNEVIQAPRLSGMESWYLERQLHAFKDGWRGTHKKDLIGMEMQPMAAGLSDKQIREVAEFVRLSRSDRPPSTVPGNARKGEALFRNCAACHGASGEGNEALAAPALTGINDWYLITQLMNYRYGIRGNNPADSYGIQMAAASQLLTDDEAIQDVVKYISTITTD